MNKLFNFDKQKLYNFDFVIGTDEAGRGPGAGPVYAAAVCFKNSDSKTIKLFEKLNDSKQLTEKVREELFDVIKAHSVYSIATGSVEEIEQKNILQASLGAMKKACDDVLQQLNSTNSNILVDGNKLIPKTKYHQEYIIKGDSKSASIAAASILAKVSRDRFMKELHKKFPEYNWAKNKGYLTKEHIDAIDKIGTTIWHRKKFLEKHFQKAEQMTLNFT